MIKIVLGNIGSGKTATAVRYMKSNPHKYFITNIDVKGKDLKHVLKLKSYMIITREVISVKKNGEENTKLSLNIKFWQDLIKKYGAINVVIDEAHIFFNPRRSMSKLNILMTDFLALLRRVLGSTEGTGELILITQLSRRLDIIAKEMATDVTYCIHHYKMLCNNCGCEWQENNEQPDRLFLCPKCNGYDLKRNKSMIEIFNFPNIDSFDAWQNSGFKGYYKHYMISDIHLIFGNYETLQFNDLFSEF